MKDKIKILLVLITISITSINSYSQGKNDTINNIRKAVNNYLNLRSNSGSIPMEMLKTATQTTYSFNNFPCADPTDEYEEKVYVTPELVTLEVYDTHSQLCYKQSKTITRGQYADFLKDLYALGIRYTDNPNIPDGGGESKIVIQDNEKILFQGIFDLDIEITSIKYIGDVFVPLMDTIMEEVFSYPYITLDHSFN